jgi:hypothetical protein
MMYSIPPVMQSGTPHQHDNHAQAPMLGALADNKKDQVLRGKPMAYVALQVPPGREVHKSSHI